MKSIISFAIVAICMLSFKKVPVPPTSIYSQHFTTLSGQVINLSSYQGKKILIVNIASENERAHFQLPELEILFDRYKENLVILAFPSNDFGNEPRSGNTLKNYLSDVYAPQFPISEVVNVQQGNASLNSLYSWLQDQNQNGVSSTNVAGDFHKYLIDDDGTLLGAYPAEISPFDNRIISGITQ